MSAPVIPQTEHSPPVTDMPEPHACDLCGLRLPARPFMATQNDQRYAFCCAGCRQVFTILADSGQFGADFRRSDLYQTSMRLGIIGNPASIGSEKVPDMDLEGMEELVLRIDGMWCSSCAWLVEKVVSSRPGVKHASVIYASDAARIYFDPAKVSKQDVAQDIRRLGYATAERDADDEGTSPERRSLLVRMGVALFIMMNAMFFSYTLYVGYVSELPPDIVRIVPLVLWGLATPSVLWAAYPIHKKAFQAVRAGAPTLDVLYSLGILTSYLYSTVAALSGSTHVYFDTATGLVGLLLVGKFIESGAKSRVAGHIRNLHKTLPGKIRLRTAAGEKLVRIQETQPGDIFIVRSGEKIPADGTVVSGSGLVDEALITGEHKPVEKQVGDHLLGSSIHLEGYIEASVERTGRQMLVSSMIDLMETALSGKSRIEQAVDKVVRVFIPVVIGIALMTGLVHAMLGGAVDEVIMHAIAVLVIACPCALGMATPLAISAGIGYAASRGILVRDAEALQRARAARFAVFDKTGTVTLGTFSVESIASDMPQANALFFLASLEQGSNHPIARAFLQAAERENITPGSVTDVRVVTGQGLSGKVNGRAVCIGTKSFVDKHVPDTTAVQSQDERMAGRTMVWFAIDDLRGTVLLGDEIRPGIDAVVEDLHAQGIDTYLLSGDAAEPTQAVASAVGIRTAVGGVLPSAKQDFIRSLRARGPVMMVGDGVNDGPALAEADLGIAVGNATEFAVSASSVTLLREDLGLVPEIIGLSQRTYTVLVQNLFWAFLYNAVGIGLAIGGVLSPFFAAVAMLFSSLSVVINSARLKEPPGTLSARLLDVLVPWRE